MKLRKGQKGLSLVEVTIMLLVLMLLTSVMAPSIFDFVNDAQWVKVKEDCEVLAISIARLVKDVGPNLVTQSGDYGTYKLELMISDGKAPILANGIAPPTGYGSSLATWHYQGDGVSVPNNHIGMCDDQLITDLNGSAQIYPEPTEASDFGPFFGKGWRGSYISPPCGPDPWGNMYEVNTQWLTRHGFNGTSADSVIFHCQDVFCLSAGKNGIIETQFGVDSTVSPQYTRRGGDDWVTVIAPCDP